MVSKELWDKLKKKDKAYLLGVLNQMNVSYNKEDTTDKDEVLSIFNSFEDNEIEAALKKLKEKE